MIKQIDKMKGRHKEKVTADIDGDTIPRLISQGGAKWHAKRVIDKSRGNMYIRKLM